MTANDLFAAAAPSLMKTWFGDSTAINSSLEPSLAELVKIRASQINGCANCINMHTAEARERGETEQRPYLLAAWRDAPCYGCPLNVEVGHVQRIRLDELAARLDVVAHELAEEEVGVVALAAPHLQE